MLNLSAIFLKPLKATFLLLVIFTFSLISSACSQPSLLNLTTDSLKNKQAEYNLNKQIWSYHPGDNQNWKDIKFTDSLWTNVNPKFGNKDIIPNWKGKGWFRLEITIDTTLTRETLALRINHDGASEIYVDGVLRGGFGKIGTSESNIKIERAPFELIPFQINDTRKHIIAIRYCNYKPIYPDFAGFQIWVGKYLEMHTIVEKNKKLFSYMYFCVAAQIALALLHLFLFIFYPKQKINFYYFMFSIFFAATSWSICTYNITYSPFIQYISNFIFLFSCSLGIASAWLLLYSVGNVTIPKWKATAVVIITLFFCTKYLLNPLSNLEVGFNIVFLVFMLDGVWQLLKAIRKQTPYAWIVGLGMVIVILLYFFVGADVFRLWKSYALRCLVMSIGLLSFPFCYSIYLALDFARTNQNLSQKLQEVEELSFKAIIQEKDKLELITQQADKLEVTVALRTAEVRQQADKLKEMDAFKSRFFINLTHEFRTPLTLILGPATQLLNDLKNERSIVFAKTIQHNAEGLLNLVNQLLDINKLEAGKMELINQSTEIVNLIKGIFLSFESLANQKNIDLNFESNWENLWISVDQGKLERIIYNILSNSIKFTDSGGIITINLNKSDEAQFQITITDTGIGIDEKKIPYIFDRFYQADSSDTRKQEGTGIGLAITKELTELMDGEILIYSRKNIGTKVTIKIPLKITEAKNTPSVDSEAFLKDLPQTKPISCKLITEKDLPLILVVEDNIELQNYITHLLTEKYEVINAANGSIGIEKCLEKIPDLVITDLMMPFIDGYQVCKALKKDSKTSHIPIIILSAKVDIESRLNGLETEADAYLSKPFDSRELITIVDNLIKTRLQLREKFGKDNSWLTNSTELASMEKVFLNKVKQSIQLNLDNEEYSVEKLGENIGLSRTQLHRKLIALINQSPGDLIRIIRLERAYELLKSKVGTVSEVAYMVGYGNPKNFSTSFSKHFGFSPSEAINN